MAWLTRKWEDEEMLLRCHLAGSLSRGSQSSFQAMARLQWRDEIDTARGPSKLRPNGERSSPSVRKL
jgi:hypothetical protein